MIATMHSHTRTCTVRWGSRSSCVRSSKRQPYMFHWSGVCWVDHNHTPHQGPLDYSHTSHHLPQNNHLQYDTYVCNCETWAPCMQWQELDNITYSLQWNLTIPMHLFIMATSTHATKLADSTEFALISSNCYTSFYGDKVRLAGQTAGLPNWPKRQTVLTATAKVSKCMRSLYMQIRNRPYILSLIPKVHE